MAAALWPLATGNAYICVGIALGIDTSNAYKYTKDLCQVIYVKRSEFTKFPTDFVSVIQEFCQRTDIPNVVGAIDGSPIPIEKRGKFV